MKVLVTGGAGFVGSHTVVELIENGHEPVIVDSLVNSRESVLDRIGHITGTRPKLHELDLRDETGLEGVLSEGGFEAVLHFAGLKAVGESVARPLDYYDANLGGSTTLFRLLDKHDVKTVVFSSSATVYGDPEQVPVREDLPTKPPTSPYGWSKLIIEQILGDVHRSDRTWNVAVLRYFNPVGAHPSGMIGEDPGGIPNNLMPYIAQVAMKRLAELPIYGSDYPTRDGTGIRDYIHVVDLAKGHVAALAHLATDSGFHVWNLGTGSGTTVLELVDTFERVSGVKIPRRVVTRRPGDIAASWADTTKARLELGWTAALGIEEMCADTWRWQQYAETLD